MIFDLDGVICDTARYHFLAWNKLAQMLGVRFTQEDNERLKGVSREKSLEILLEIGGVDATDSQKREWTQKKNEWYVEFISKMTEDDLIAGAADFLAKVRAEGKKTALASASRNTGLILERLHISEMFDCIVDGNMISRAKPDPEVFLLAASGLGLMADECIVFEDAQAGVEAAHRAGMRCVGVGISERLRAADFHIKDFAGERLGEAAIWTDV